MKTEKKGPPPNQVNKVMPLYFAGGRHIGFKCTECGGTWVIGEAQWHYKECRVRKDSLALDG